MEHVRTSTPPPGEDADTSAGDAAATAIASRVYGHEPGTETYSPTLPLVRAPSRKQRAARLAEINSSKSSSSSGGNTGGAAGDSGGSGRRGDQVQEKVIQEVEVDEGEGEGEGEAEGEGEGKEVGQPTCDPRDV